MGQPARWRVCGHFHREAGHCREVEGVRTYVQGPRCARHTPAALAGRPEPGAGAYCPPEICWCGGCPAAADPDRR